MRTNLLRGGTISNKIDITKPIESAKRSGGSPGERTKYQTRRSHGIVGSVANFVKSQYTTICGRNYSVTANA